MDFQDMTTLTQDQMRSIWDFNCNDPFSFLGIHSVETDRGFKTAIRVYLPGAAFISGESIPEETEEANAKKTSRAKSRKSKKASSENASFVFDFVKIGDSGFFEAVLDMEFQPFFYKLHVTLENGRRLFRIIE